jgi:MFS family permease/1-acyl-sn-glycerol-3-phosphate acyltransferase
MVHQPADTLKNRSFIGLIIAQFLAGFNDQAIHAAAMFYAIRMDILTEKLAISLMPILFYAPWAIFCTLSGYLADRFSKRYALVIWKIAEVFIAAVALLGFYLGTVHGDPLGAWLVLSTVFLMGTHAAFFAPAKYGAMPEILQPHVLSRGNGILESTTFLAAILGTVTGGLLSMAFRGQEYYIGVVLLLLAMIGAVASFAIAYLPPANPARLFPKNPLKPLFDNLKVLFRSRPLALSVLGIAFFIFMVSYMRATMYMHGETRNPKWDEFHTSLVVATVALGVGLGSPLAGFLSGGKVELGLVPLGCLGMIVGTLFAAFALNITWALITGLIIIGFFSGFYMVPLYTLLQHRAPKTSKGDLVATSNFINVCGAMAASVLFFLLVQAGQLSGLTPRLQVEANPELDKPLKEGWVRDGVAEGILIDIERNPRDGQPVLVVVQTETRPVAFQAKSILQEDGEQELETIDFDDHAFELAGISVGDEVVVSGFMLRGLKHYKVRLAEKPLSAEYDYEALPRYLFFGAAFMTLVILTLLVLKLPDFFVRSLFWIRCLGRYRLKVVGMHNLPTNGPVILANNCAHFDSSLQLVAATDRYTHFILVEEPPQSDAMPLLRYLACRSGFTMVPPGPNSTPRWQDALSHAQGALQRNDLLAISMDGQESSAQLDQFLEQLPRATTPIIPVYCGPLIVNGQPMNPSRIRVVFGYPLRADASLDDIRHSIHVLGEWLRQVEAEGTAPVTRLIPRQPKDNPEPPKAPEHTPRNEVPPPGTPH